MMNSDRFNALDKMGPINSKRSDSLRDQSSEIRRIR